MKFITDVNSPINSSHGYVYKIGNTISNYCPKGLLGETQDMERGMETETTGTATGLDIKYETSKLLSKYEFNITSIQEESEGQIIHYNIKVCINRKKTFLENLKQKIGWCK
jgi:hypothetical protein